MEGLQSIKIVRDEAEKYYSGKLFMAQDYDTFYLDRDGELELESRRQWKSKKPSES